MACHLANDNLANNFSIDCSIAMSISSMLSSFMFSAAVFFAVMVSTVMGCVADAHVVVLSEAFADNNLAKLPIRPSPSKAWSRGDEPDKYSEQLMHSRRIPVSTAKSARSTSSATTSCGGGVMMKMQDVDKPAISSGKCPFHHLSIAIINSFDLQNCSDVNTFLMA